MIQQGKAYQVDLDTLITGVMNRIDALSQSLADQGLSGRFGGAAGKPATVGDGFGLMGSLVFDMFVWNSLISASDVILETGGVTDGPSASLIFNDTVIAGMEAYSLLSDERVYNFRTKRVYDYYPQGRRNPGKITNPKKAKQFNAVANQNIAPTYSKEAELMGLYDVLDKLEAIQKKHIRNITFEKRKSAYDTISKLHRALQKNGGVNIMATGFRMAV